MRIKSQKDFFAGLLYVVIGGGFAIGATNYTVGNAARMGPGYFPLLVGILLVSLAASTLSAWRNRVYTMDRLYSMVVV